MNAAGVFGWLGRVYLLVLLALAVLAVAWSLDTFVLTAGDRSIWLSLAAAVLVFGALGWAFRRVSR